MIFGLIVGTLLGFSRLETPFVILILVAALAAKVFVDVKWEKQPLTGRVSPFVVYWYNLSQAGEPVDHAWISYAMQVLFFGVLLGGVVCALVRWFM